MTEKAWQAIDAEIKARQKKLEDFVFAHLDTIPDDELARLIMKVFFDLQFTEPADKDPLFQKWLCTIEMARAVNRNQA